MGTRENAVIREYVEWLEERLKEYGMQQPFAYFLQQLHTEVVETHDVVDQVEDMTIGELVDMFGPDQ